MKEDLHNIDKLFKSSIEEHEEMPSPEIWAALDKNLDKNKVIDITKRYVTLRKVAIILLVLLATISFYEVSTWTNADKTVENQKVKENYNNLPRNNNAAGTNKIINKVDKKNPALKETSDTLGSSNGGEEYTITNNTGLDKENVKEKTLPNDLQETLAIRAEDKTIRKNKQQFSTPLDISATTNKSFVIVPENNHFRQGEIENQTIKKNSIIAGTGVKQEIVSTRADVSSVFTGSVQVTAPGSIDTYSNFSLPLFADRMFLFVADNKSRSPVKLSVNKKSRFAVTVFYSRDFVSNRLIMDKVGNHERDRDEIRSTESASSSFTTGVLAEYSLTRNLSLQSGLNISKTTIHIEPKTIYAKPDNFGNLKFRFNCSAGYSFLSLKTGMPPASGDSLRAFESSNTTQYIGIPLAIKYNAAAGRFRFNFTAGISANILSNQKIKTVIANGSNNEKSVINEINGLKPVYFSGLLGLGIDYYISKNIALSFLPNGRFALTSINKDAPIRSYPQSFGLGAGIRLQL